MKRVILGAIAAALGTVVLAAAAGAQQSDQARVRVLHASPDAPAVDVFVDGAEAISDLAFGDITDYVALPSGAHNVQVFPADADGSGTPVIDADVTLDPSTDYTVAAAGAVAAIEPVVLVDDNSAPAQGEAKVRFVHLSPDAPAVDIYAEGAGVIVPGAAFKDASGYLGLPAGTYDLQVRAAGTETVALDLPGVSIDEGTVYSAFAIGLLQGEPALTAKLTVDSTAAPAQQAAPATGLPSTGQGVTSDDGFDAGTWITVGALSVLGLVAIGAAGALVAVRRNDASR